MKNKLIIFLNIILLNSISLINSAFKVEKRVKIQQTTQQKMREKCFWGGRPFQFAVSELTPSEVIENSLTKKFGDYKKFSVDEILQCLEFANKEIKNEDKEGIIKLIVANLKQGKIQQQMLINNPEILQYLINAYPKIIKEDYIIAPLFGLAVLDLRNKTINNDKNLESAKILLMNGMNMNAKGQPLDETCTHDLIARYGFQNPLINFIQAYTIANSEYLKDLKEMLEEILDSNEMANARLKSLVKVKFDNYFDGYKDKHTVEEVMTFYADDIKFHRIIDLKRIIEEREQKTKEALEGNFPSVVVNIIEQYLGHKKLDLI